jgi:hypothetical protein
VCTLFLILFSPTDHFFDVGRTRGR